MYLTARKLGKPRGLHDHEQLELLLESFSKQVEEIVSEVDSTVVRCLARSISVSNNLGEHAIHARDYRADARQ